MVKVKIGTKLFATYFVIIIVSLSVTAFLFNFLSQRYLIDEARQELRREGRRLAEVLGGIPLEFTRLHEKILAARQLRIAGKVIEAKIIILNKEGKIVFSNMQIPAHVDIFNLLRSRKTGEYVYERVEIRDKAGNSKGRIVLVSKVGDIKALNRVMTGVQVLSFIIAAVISLVIAYFFGKSLTDPINKLMNSMKDFSPRRFQQAPQIKTGDEIEELCLCFTNMAGKLKSYDEKQRSFLQNTSHELKTPLMSIQGYAEAIKDGVIESREMEECLDIIIEESQRLKTTVEEIIYLTKLENAEECFNFKEGILGDVIAGAIKSVNPLANEKGILIKINGGMEYRLLLDESKLKRAFINLLGNCVRFAVKEIVVDINRVKENLAISVTDDGPGFKEAELNKVFDRFYKGENGGTGLGLSIARAIIEGHGGNIYAFNNKPCGAGFKIHLPLNRSLIGSK